MELNITIRLSIIYLIVTTVFYTLLLYVFESDFYNYASAAALIIGLIVVFFHQDSQIKLHKFENSVQVVFNKYICKEGIGIYTTFIVIINAIVGIVGFYLISNRVDFQILSNQNVDFRSIFMFGNSFGVIVSQVGGWIFQAYLIFLLSTFLGGVGNIYHYINLVGLSYLGFLLSALASIMYNSLVFETSSIDVEKLTEIFNTSYFHLISGKLGEFVVLSILCVGVMLIERKFTLFKSFFVAVIPSLLILLFNILMQL